MDSKLLVRRMIADKYWNKKAQIKGADLNVFDSNSGHRVYSYTKPSGDKIIEGYDSNFNVIKSIIRTEIIDPETGEKKMNSVKTKNSVTKSLIYVPNKIDLIA